MVTLGAVAAVGAGRFLVNVSQQPTAAVPQRTATAYACDNYGIETWLAGSSDGGVC